MQPRYFIAPRRGVGFHDERGRWYYIEQDAQGWVWGAPIDLRDGPALVAQAVEWMANNYVVPDAEEAALRRFIDHGIIPGSFLSAVIENNLVSAFHAADADNRNLIFCYIRWMWQKAPSACWGSAEKVIKWGAHRGLERRKL